MYGAFWDKKIQKASGSDLKKLQLKLLRKQIARAYECSSFYRRKLKMAKIKPAAIKTLDDVHRLPFVTRQELETNFDDVLGVPLSKIATVRMTSGTTGHPLKVAHSHNDVNVLANASARKLTYHGVTYKDRVQVAAAYGLAQGAWSVHWGAERIGACVIPVGPGDTERQIRIIKQLRSTVLYGATNFHLRILEVAQSLGENLSRNRLRVGMCVAERPSKKQVAMLKRGFGYERVAIDYGSTEFPGFSANCENDAAFHHVWADYYLAETVDPATHEPVGEGERGELVVSSLQREAFPLIRYLSRDITSVFGFEECSCGMSHPKISADIDREDFMVKIRGVSVFPSHVEFILAEFPTLVGTCQIIVDKRTPSQDVTLKVETTRPLSPVEERNLRSRVIDQVKNRVGVTVGSVVLVPKGTFESKFPKSVTIV
jgi:phenylacetate-CoA ligase